MAFTKDDQIVVCGTCEMPHHLSCWQENNGCTTFGCTGVIKEFFGKKEVPVISETNKSGVEKTVLYPQYQIINRPAKQTALRHYSILRRIASKAIPQL